MQIAALNNPVEEAVKQVIKNTSLLTLPKQYNPWQDVLKLKNESAFPLVTCTTLEMRVDPHSNYAQTDVLIAVYDLAPPEDATYSDEDRSMWIATTAHKYASDLLEVTDWLGNVYDGMEMFQEEQYRWVTERIFRPQFRRGLYTTKEEFKSHSIRDRLYAATVTGTLRGTLQGICCKSSLVVPDPVKVDFVYPDGVDGVIIGIPRDLTVKQYEVQYRISDDSAAWVDVSDISKYDQVVLARVPIGLNGGNTYQGRVRVTSFSGVTSDWVEFDWLQYTDVATPELIEVDAGPSTANVSWGAVAGAVSYDIRYRISGSESWSYVNANPDTDFFLTGLTSASGYDLGIRARTAIGSLSSWSSETFNTLN